MKTDHISIEVHQHDFIPAFAAFYADGSVNDKSKAKVVINISALVGIIQDKQIKPSEVPYVVAENLYHEIIHVLEEWAEVEFSEERVEALVARYNQEIGERLYPSIWTKLKRLIRRLKFRS